MVPQIFVFVFMPNRRVFIAYNHYVKLCFQTGSATDGRVGYNEMFCFAFALISVGTFSNSRQGAINTVENTPQLVLALMLISVRIPVIVTNGN